MTLQEQIDNVNEGMWREIRGFVVVSCQLCLLVINELQTG